LRKKLMDLDRKLDLVTQNAKQPKFAQMKKKNHQCQMDHLEETRDALVNETRRELARLFPSGVPTTLSEVIDKGEAKLNMRAKKIAIADGSELGWKVVEAYEGSQLADGESDARKLEEAEKKAAKKDEERRKRFNDGRAGGGGAGGGYGVGSSGSGGGYGGGGGRRRRSLSAPRARSTERARSPAKGAR
jgi:uncharacterized membrane protein YgcG